MSLTEVNNSRKFSSINYKSQGYFFNLIPKFYFLTQFTYSLPVVFSYRFLIFLALILIFGRGHTIEPNETGLLPFLDTTQSTHTSEWMLSTISQVKILWFAWILNHMCTSLLNYYNIFFLFCWKLVFSSMQVHQFSPFSKTTFFDALSRSKTISLHEVLLPVCFEQDVL